MNHNWYKLQSNCITNIIQESRYQASSDQWISWITNMEDSWSVWTSWISVVLSFFWAQIIPDGNFLTKIHNTKNGASRETGTEGSYIWCIQKASPIVWCWFLSPEPQVAWSVISSRTTTWIDFFDKRDLVSQHAVLSETYGTSAMIRTGQPISSSPPVRFVLRVHGLPGKSLVASGCCHSTHLLGWPTTQDAIVTTRIITFTLRGSQAKYSCSTVAELENPNLYVIVSFVIEE